MCMAFYIPSLWKLFKTIIPQSISCHLFSLSSSICLLFAPDFWSSLPNHFCWLQWSYKSSDLIYSSFYKGARGPKRGSDFSRITQQISGSAEIKIRMLDSQISALSTSGLDQLIVGKEPGSRWTPVLGKGELSKEQGLKVRAPCRVGGLTDWIFCWEWTLYVARWRME